MKVKTETVYVFDGNQYPSTIKVQEEVENRLGAIVDKLPGNFGAGERIKVYDWLVANKEVIKPLLDVTIDLSEDVLYSDVKNIFDL